MKTLFAGSIVALVTPLRNNIVDLKALEKLINWQIESGTDGIVVCGSTGEGLLLTEVERQEIISAAVSIANKRTKIIAGCSACSPTHALKLVNQAEALHADGVLVVAPYYVKPTPAGIKDYFNYIAANSNIPIIIYNNPSRCAVNMSVETIVELFQNERICALKDSDTNLAKATLIRSIVSKNINLLSGDDSTLAGYLAHGGDGAISVVANIVPQLVKKMMLSWTNGDIKTVQDINEKIVLFANLLFEEPNPIIVKYALFKKGFIANELRPPLTPATKESATKIEAMLNDLIKP
ncbi:MAG: 4-hydroxy-tetrahydrodipicolinate synthase [Holosporales bacterium]|jgi:4-hydroxy-tetrahydrodipicolinate synthase|nr:4-hydroxy-tetrahydrodipicolinate synthase [Holosporales bacterium]